MKCFYINLDSAIERRASLEASFRAHAPANWELVRAPAAGPADVADVPGSLSPAEKGCWKSHRAAIFKSLVDDDGDDVLVVEDDVRFGPRTFEMLERVSAKDAPWDLCYTEVGLRVEHMLLFAQRYPHYAATGSVSLQDLSRRGFWGACGYLVRGRSKAKLVRQLDAAVRLDRAYDLYLQDLVHAGRVRSVFCFPFLTGPGPFAEHSQIQPDVRQLRDQMHSAFRSLMNLDRDLDALEPELQRLEALHGERGAAMVGKVFGALVSEAMATSAPAPVALKADGV